MWRPPDFSRQILSAFAAEKRQGGHLRSHCRARHLDLDTAPCRNGVAPHVAERNWRPQVRGEGGARDPTGLDSLPEDPRASRGRLVAVDPQTNEPPVHVPPRRSALDDLLPEIASLSKADTA